MPEDITQLTAIGIIFIFAIKEFFTWLREKSNKKNGGDIATRVAVMEEKLGNHCVHLDKEMTQIRGDIRTITGEIVDIKLKMK